MFLKTISNSSFHGLVEALERCDALCKILSKIKLTYNENDIRPKHFSWFTFVKYVQSRIFKKKTIMYMFKSKTVKALCDKKND